MQPTLKHFSSVLLAAVVGATFLILGGAPRLAHSECVFDVNLPNQLPEVQADTRRPIVKVTGIRTPKEPGELINKDYADSLMGAASTEYESAQERLLEPNFLTAGTLIKKQYFLPKDISDLKDTTRSATAFLDSFIKVEPDPKGQGVNYDTAFGFERVFGTNSGTSLYMGWRYRNNDPAMTTATRFSTWVDIAQDHFNSGYVRVGHLILTRHQMNPISNDMDLPSFESDGKVTAPATAFDLNFDFPKDHGLIVASRNTDEGLYLKYDIASATPTISTVNATKLTLSVTPDRRIIFPHVLSNFSAITFDIDSNIYDLAKDTHTIAIIGRAGASPEYPGAGFGPLNQAIDSKGEAFLVAPKVNFSPNFDQVNYFCINGQLCYQDVRKVLPTRNGTFLAFYAQEPAISAQPQLNLKAPVIAFKSDMADIASLSTDLYTFKSKFAGGEAILGAIPGKANIVFDPDNSKLPSARRDERLVQIDTKISDPKLLISGDPTLGTRLNLDFDAGASHITIEPPTKPISLSASATHRVHIDTAALNIGSLEIEDPKITLQGKSKTTEPKIMFNDPNVANTIESELPLSADDARYTFQKGAVLSVTASPTTANPLTIAAPGKGNFLVTDESTLNIDTERTIAITSALKNISKITIQSNASSTNWTLSPGHLDFSNKTSTFKIGAGTKIDLSGQRITHIPVFPTADASSNYLVSEEAVKKSSAYQSLDNYIANGDLDANNFRLTNGDDVSSADQGHSVTIKNLTDTLFNKRYSNSGYLSSVQLDFVAAVSSTDGIGSSFQGNQTYSGYQGHTYRDSDDYKPTDGIPMHAWFTYNKTLYQGIWSGSWNKYSAPSPYYMTTIPTDHRFAGYNSSMVNGDSTYTLFPATCSMTARLAEGKFSLAVSDADKWTIGRSCMTSGATADSADLNHEPWRGWGDFMYPASQFYGAGLYWGWLHNADGPQPKTSVPVAPFGIQSVWPIISDPAFQSSPTGSCVSFDFKLQDKANQSGNSMLGADIAFIPLESSMHWAGSGPGHDCIQYKPGGTTSIAAQTTAPFTVMITSQLSYLGIPTLNGDPLPTIIDPVTFYKGGGFPGYYGKTYYPAPARNNDSSAAYYGNMLYRRLYSRDAIAIKPKSSASDMTTNYKTDYNSTYTYSLGNAFATRITAQDQDHNINLGGHTVAMGLGHTATKLVRMPSTGDLFYVFQDISDDYNDIVGYGMGGASGYNMGSKNNKSATNNGGDAYPISAGYYTLYGHVNLLCIACYLKNP